MFGLLKKKVTPPPITPAPRSTWVPVIGDTWACHVCTVERPDKKITVFSLEKVFHNNLRMRVNVRHCIDKQDCIDHAPNIAREWLSFADRGNEDG